MLDSPGVRDFAPAVEQLDAAALWDSSSWSSWRRLPLRRLPPPARARLRGARRGRQRSSSARRYESYRRLRRLYRAAVSTRRGRAARADARRQLGSAQLNECRPASACASVPPSTYSSSPPTGTPCAMRLAAMPCARTSSEKKCAVASPSTVGLVARMTSLHAALPQQRLEFARARAPPGRRHRAARDAPSARNSGRDSRPTARSPPHRPATPRCTAWRHRAADWRRSHTAVLRSACGSGCSGPTRSSACVERLRQRRAPRAGPPAADETPCAEHSSDPRPASDRSASINAAERGGMLHRERSLRTAASCPAAATCRP